MAGRFNNPYPQFLDSTPEAYSGGTLTFYASGTSTPQSIYSDESLSTPITNPVTLNAAGRASTDIFLQDLEYKVVLKDSSGNTIWTADPVSARDSSLIAKTLTGSGSPNGNVAGTAGSSTILPDFYWDYTNQILYVCTTTGSSSTAVWTAINASSATASVPPPQGRLTLTSNTPVLTSGVSAATAVYYTPFIGNQAPIYNGSTMVPTEFSELTLTLSSSHSANNIYDIFLFSNAGVITLATGPAWSSATAGSGSRGTGAGTTELTRVKGLWVNAVSMTGRNGSTTYTIGANLGTYLGSIFMDSSNGQVTCHTAFGQSRKWGVWNAYNRQPINLLAGDSTASWVYSTTTIRPSNNSTANSLTVFMGLAEQRVQVEFTQTVRVATTTSNSGQAVYSIGIGWNSTTAFSGLRGSVENRVDASSSAIDFTMTTPSRYVVAPSLGTNVTTSLETTGGTSGTPTITRYGQETGMALSAVYQG
jgi:hypothetical protein